MANAKVRHYLIWIKRLSQQDDQYDDQDKRAESNSDSHCVTLLVE